MIPYLSAIRISGGTALGASQRSSLTDGPLWGNDIRSYKPTAATIMLGMNDVGVAHFNKVKTEDELNKANQMRFDQYKSRLATILDNLNKQGITNITLIKSSPYDQTQINPNARENLFQFGRGKNDAIRNLGEKILDPEAAQRNLKICDFNTPMLEINKKYQLNDPAYSIIGKDRVHPADEGHMVMAYLFLKNQNVQSIVSNFKIDTQKGNASIQENCTISKLEISDQTIQFDYIANSLPFPTAPYQSITNIIPFESELNQETLQVSGLNKGIYRVSISDVAIGKYSNTELNEGINLGTLATAPQVKQSNKVYELCLKRAEVAKRLRAVLFTEGWLRRLKISKKLKDYNPNSIEENKAMCSKMIPEEKKIYKKRKLQAYLDDIDQYDSLLQKLHNYSKTLYELAKPQALKVTISIQ